MLSRRFGRDFLNRKIIIQIIVKINFFRGIICVKKKVSWKHLFNPGRFKLRIKKLQGFHPMTQLILAERIIFNQRIKRKNKNQLIPLLAKLF